MSIRVSCPSCSASFKVKDEYAGKRGKCPQCGNPIRIPTGDGPGDTIKMPPGAFLPRPAKPKPSEGDDASPPPGGAPRN